MALARLRLRLDRRAEGEPGGAAAERRPGPRAAGRRSAGAGIPVARPGRQGPGDQPGSGRIALGSLQAAGLSAHRAGPACGDHRHHLCRPRVGRPRRRRLHGQPGPACRSHRGRHRYAVPADRGNPHLDLYFTPSGLAGRSDTLAGKDSRDRGPSFRRSSRQVDETLRRPQDKRLDEAAERERVHGS